MLKIPENWHEINEASIAQKKMPAGGYVCKIVKAFDSVNKYDDPCLTLYLDVDEGDFKNYFGEIYKRRLDRGRDKYPCVCNLQVNSFGARRLKLLMTVLELSNEDFRCDFDGGDFWDETEIEGLRLGVVFREKEFKTKRGAVYTNLVPQFLKTVEEITDGDFVVPEKLTIGGHDNG